MSASSNYPKGLVLPETHSVPRPRFSLTSDIISYRKCRRQYGYFGQDGFVPAQAVQIFFGQVIHQVLDRCHRHYSGKLDPTMKGTLPTDAEIEQYFDEVEQALRAHGIRPASPYVAIQAKQVLKTFNRLEGPVLYPRVIDTEYRLESERKNFVLRGVVDVIAEDGTGEPEIWDYKGTDKPPLSSNDLRDYEWQMSVYAELYKVKAGRYPVRAVLYFLNELKTKPGDPTITKRPVPAVHIVDFMREGVESDGTPKLVKQGLDAFDITAADIIACKQSHCWDAPTGTDKPDEKTCDICDIRWSCASHPKTKYRVRMPI